MDFDGKRILVTGGTQGIGKSIVKKMSDFGGEVYITGTRKTYEYDKFFSVDFSCDKSFKKFLSSIEDTRFDILINNAGINKVQNLDNLDLNEYSKIMKVNVEAPLKLTKHLCKKMKQNRYGRVVNISSIYGNVSQEKRISYSCSKFALKGITKSIAVEMAQFNVLVNSVSPGFTDTELTRTILSTQEIFEIQNKIPIKRMANPDEIANLVCFLASEYNSYVCGQDYIIDGGYCSV